MARFFEGVGGQPRPFSEIGDNQDGTRRFLGLFAKAYCRQTFAYRQGELRQELNNAVEKALALHGEFNECGLLPGQLEAILGSLAYRNDDSDLFAQAREDVVCKRLEAMLDRKMPDSLLCRVANGAVPDPVLKQISSQLNEGLRYRVNDMPRLFNCALDAREILAGLEKALTAKLQDMLGEHLEAKDAIGGSTFNPEQQTLFGEIANGHRIDRVQVEQFQLAAGKMAEAARALKTAIESGDPASALATFNSAGQTFEECYEKMRIEGESRWDFSLQQNPVKFAFNDECAKLASRELSPEEATGLINSLSAHEGALPGSVQLSLSGAKTLMLVVSALAQQHAGMTQAQADALSDRLRA